MIYHLSFYRINPIIIIINIYPISPWYNDIFRVIYQHKTIISNPNGDIKSKCQVGFKQNTKCQQSTIKLPIGSNTHIINWMFPILFCANHEVYSYLVGYDKYSPRDKSGPLHVDATDIILNPLHSWTLIPFNTKKVELCSIFP